MKKFLPILAIALVLFGCEKSDEKKTDTEVQKYDVSFNVTDFSQTVVPLGNKRTSAVGDTLKNYATNLYYKLYDESGTILKSTEQLSSATGFGTITDKLAPGDYTAFFVATTGNLAFSGTQFTTSLYYPSTTTYWNDTYTKTIAFTVSTSAVTQAIRLSRIVGAIEVNLEDVIPNTISKITVAYVKESPKLQLTAAGDGIFGTLTKDFNLTSADYNVKNKKYLMHIGNIYGLASSVVIRAYDFNNAIVAEKTVTNVICYQNKKTVLTGTLFPTPTNQNIGFTVSVDPTWGTSTTPIRF